MPLSNGSTTVRLLGFNKIYSLNHSTNQSVVQGFQTGPCSSLLTSGDMKSHTNKTWNSEQLVHMSNALGRSYMPGLQTTKVANSDRWIAQRPIRVSALIGQAYL